MSNKREKFSILARTEDFTSSSPEDLRQFSDYKDYQNQQLSKFTGYFINEMFKLLREIIEKYRKVYGNHEAAYQFGFNKSTAAAKSIKYWRNNGTISLKHLNVLCKETGYDIKSLIRSSDVLIKGRYSHKEVPWEDVLEFL